MTELLVQAVRDVNLFYTLLLGALAMYWITVILGFLDIEIFDFDFDFDADIEGAGLANILSILNLGAIPFSIWISIFALQMWLYSIISNLAIDEISAFTPSDALRFVLVALLFIPLAATVTKFATAPLKKAFESRSTSKTDFVGQECLVTSSEVSEDFGTAEIRFGGALHLIDIRAKPGEALTRNGKALIYKYDEERDVFYVTSV